MGLGMSLRWSLRTDGDVPGPLRLIVTLSQKLVPSPWPSASLISAPSAFVGAQTGLLGPLPQLSSPALQPAHPFLPPLGSWPGSFQEDGAKAKSNLTFSLRDIFF
uniref:Uncharacterized protein n=1 Tax=Peromyscus maniculatus bairdii TaxID=230844 RepID=A0A8C8UA22_PERMB